MLQPEKGFRAGINSVFLAAAVPCAAGRQRVRGRHRHRRCRPVPARPQPGRRTVTGVEIAARYAMICEENARRNGLPAGCASSTPTSARRCAATRPAMPAPGSFAHAMANPPFFDEGKSTASPHLLKSQAHAFGPEDLDLWVKVLHAMLAPRGSVTIVHRAETLGQLLRRMQNRFGDIRIAPLYARAGAAASRILVQGIKGSKAPLQILPGLVLHDEGNGFTPEAEAVLRDGAAFPLR